MNILFFKTLQAKYPKLTNYGIFLFNFLFSAFICWAVTGGSPRFHDILLLWILWNSLWFKPIIFKIMSPLMLLWVLYSPAGLQYGYPNSGVIASVFATNVNEIKEFLDFKTIFYFIVFISCGVFTFYFSKNVNPTTKQYRFFKYFSIILALLFLSNIISFKHQRIHWGYSELLGIIPHTKAQYEFYMMNKAKMKALSEIRDEWQVIDFKPKYQNYILVIGESASKHYLSAYDYPVDTSPFLKQVKGTKYTQAISPAIYTIKSIPRLLTIPNAQEVEYQNNILTLANKLGMQTYWLSNQDKMGEYENEISYIATYAKQDYYLSVEAPTTARYDYQLLPKFQEILATPSEQPRLIVVHLMGSHTRFSKRVDYEKAHFTFKDKYLSAYLSSLLQTDMLLQDIYDSLNKSQKTFSMIYLSDHALLPISLKHGMSQFSLQVPLFKISSDDHQKNIDDSIISGMSFIWFLTEWLGVDTLNQKQNNFLNDYRVHSLENVKIFDDHIKSYLSVEPFDGKMLMPSKEEFRE